MARGGILFIHPSGDLFGADRMALLELDVLSQVAEVSVLVGSDGPLVELLKARHMAVKVIKLPELRRERLRPTQFVRFAFGMTRSTFDLARIVRQRRPRLVYVNTMVVPSAIVGARLARTLVVCHVHEAEVRAPLLIQALLTWPLRLVVRSICNSHSTAAFVSSVWPKAAARAVVVHNGVPDAGDATSLPAERPVVLRLLVVGRWFPRKGPDIAVEALKLLLDRGVAATLTLLGGPARGWEQFDTQLRARVAELGLDSAVRFESFVSEPGSFFRDAHFVLVPSRGETFGLGAVEGMLHERPIVASAVDGLLEVFEDGYTGVAVPVGDAHQLAQAVAGLASDWDRARQMSVRARSAALENFSVERFNEQLLAALSGAYE